MSELVALMKYVAIGKVIRKRLTHRQKSTLTSLSRHLLGISMIHCPNISLEIASHFIALVAASLLADIGLNNILNKFAIISPSAGTLKKLMILKGVDTIYLRKIGYKKSLSNSTCRLRGRL